jgi:DNA-binding Lrp family transcriptional regulator
MINSPMADAPKLDELSLQVIALLQGDGRISIREMSKRLGVSPTTVGARYNQLRDDGTIQIVAAPNPRSLGLNFHAIVEACFAPGNVERAITILEGRPEVTWIGLTLSRAGIFFEVVARDTQEFGAYKERLFAELPGLQSAEVNVIWDVRKFRYGMLPLGVTVPGGVDTADASDDADDL